MPASNSLNYANWFEIKVVGGGEHFQMKSWGASEQHCSAFRLATLLRLLTQAKIFHHCEVNTKKGVFRQIGRLGASYQSRFIVPCSSEG